MVFVNKLRDVRTSDASCRRNASPTSTGHPHRGFFPRPGPAANMRRSEAGRDRRVVVTAAMMRPGVKEDGIAFVIDACASLLPANPDLHLLIIGDGPGRTAGGPGRASCPERTPLPAASRPQDMHVWYQAGDVFAFPGINESLGMVYLEAQCCGLPVVATSHDGAPGGGGRQGDRPHRPALFRSGIRRGLSTLLTDTGLRQQFSRQARTGSRHARHGRQLPDPMFRTMAEICCEGGGHERHRPASPWPHRLEPRQAHPGHRDIPLIRRPLTPAPGGSLASTATVRGTMWS
jgi:hypothetical protein